MSTIIDVAKQAQVSIATVSRVINEPDRVKRETRTRVQDAMEMCNYQYNSLAKSFVTKRSHILGVIVPTITNQVFAESTKGIQEYTDKLNYQIVLGKTDYNQNQEERLIDVFRQMQVDGLIISTTNPRQKALQSLINEKYPFILLFSTIRRGQLSCVGVDNYQGGYLATAHLFHLGHRRIGMLAGCFKFSDKSFQRWHGYRKALKDHDIAYDPALIIQTQYTLEHGNTTVREMLARNNPPTAIFCSNDYLAIGAMEGAKSLGFKIPEDLSLVGYDDIPLVKYIDPPLTTVQNPASDIGRTAAEHLLQRIKNPNIKPKQILLEVKLIERSSTAAPIFSEILLTRNKESE